MLWWLALQAVPDIDTAMNGNLCRCGAYSHLVHAIAEVGNQAR